MCLFSLMRGRIHQGNPQCTNVVLDLQRFHTCLVIHIMIIKVLLNPFIKIILLPLTQILPLQIIKLHISSTKIPLKHTKLNLIITKESLPAMPMCSQITECLPKHTKPQLRFTKMSPPPRRLPSSIDKLPD